MPEPFLPFALWGAGKRRYVFPSVVRALFLFFELSQSKRAIYLCPPTRLWLF
jgi:hypothetical protein